MRNMRRSARQTRANEQAQPGKIARAVAAGGLVASLEVVVVATKVRAAVVSRLPPGVRRQLKRGRDRVQRAESKLRARLPQALGGRFDPDAVELRCLTPDDLRAWQRLRPAQGAQHAKPALLAASEERFVMGLWTRRGRLVAAGFCSIAQGEDGVGAHGLLAGGYVHPRFRRRGLAQRLHAARLAELARRGVASAYAWVDPINLASIAGLIRSGFVRVHPDQAPTALPRSEHEQVLLHADVSACLAANRGAI
jgi:RimJ/RimL family protein N-acetyltransferase